MKAKVSTLVYGQVLGRRNLVNLKLITMLVLTSTVLTLVSSNMSYQSRYRFDAEYYVGYSIQGFDLFYAQDTDDSDSDFFSVSYGLPTIIEGVDASLTYGDVSKKGAKD